MDHIDRVLNLSLEFAKDEEADIELVTLIALLHDVDDYKLFGTKNAENLSNAKEIMKKCHVPKEVQEQVCLAISNIGYSKRLKGCLPKTKEGKIVSDADMCDGIGAVGIVRVIKYGMKIDRCFFAKDVFPVSDLDYNYHMGKTASTVNFIIENLLNYKSLMLTKTGKEEARKRHEFMITFLYQYFREENVPEWTRYLDNYFSKSNL